MSVLIVSEGPSELSGALETLVRRLTGMVADFDLLKVSDPALRVHHGKGPGYFKKAVRCLLYAAEQSYDALVFLIDQDNQVKRRRQISDAQDELRFTILPRAMGVAVLTFDAWMLADEQALTGVLSRPIQRQPDPERIADPKSTCTVLREEAGCALGLAQFYAELANVIDLNVLEKRCPLGFEPFAQRVRHMAQQLAT